jgi:G:T-mismatch repair DNA endonuclease (very short patch repair protein)
MNAIELNILRKSNRICTNCGTEYTYKNVGNACFEKDLHRNLTLCPSCKRIVPCKICGTLFKNKSGQQTCSIVCAKELKKQSYLLSCGTAHNLSKKSKSREAWERNLLRTEGITNVFQRADVKEKIKKSLVEHLGVTAAIKSPIVVEKRNNTLKKRLEEDPLFYKKAYQKSRLTCIEKYGYDPRVVFNGYSKEAEKIFIKLFDYLTTELNLIKEDLFYASPVNNKNEYFLCKNDMFRLYDFTILSKKIIIEYNGINWHPDYRNDNSLLNWVHPFTKENYIKTYEYFNNKIELAEERGFRVLVIWDTETPEENLVKCKEFINTLIKNENKKH